MDKVVDVECGVVVVDDEVGVLTRSEEHRVVAVGRHGECK